MSRTKSKTARPEGWVQIDHDCKPSKATEAKSALRPALRHGYVVHDKEGSWLYMSDSFLMVRLPIEMGCAKNQRKKLLPEGPILHEALKALDTSKTGWFRHRDGCIEVHGNPALYPTPEGLSVPDYPKVFHGATNGGPREAISEIAFNPYFLQRAAEAVGVRRAGIKVELAGKLRPIRLIPMAGSGEAIVMPVRLNT